MECPKCKHENPDEAKFCGKCGDQAGDNGNILSSRSGWAHPPTSIEMYRSSCECVKGAAKPKSEKSSEA